MGKFRCECDKHTFSDTVLPNDQYFCLVPSEIVWETPEKLDGDYIATDKEIEIWECPECKGLTRFDGTAYRTCYYKRVDDAAQREAHHPHQHYLSARSNYAKLCATEFKALIQSETTKARIDELQTLTRNTVVPLYVSESIMKEYLNNRIAALQQLFERK